MAPGGKVKDTWRVVVGGFMFLLLLLLLLLLGGVNYVFVAISLCVFPCCLFFLVPFSLLLLFFALLCLLFGRFCIFAAVVVVDDDDYDDDDDDEDERTTSNSTKTLTWGTALMAPEREREHQDPTAIRTFELATMHQSTLTVLSPDHVKARMTAAHPSHCSHTTSKTLQQDRFKTHNSQNNFFRVVVSWGFGGVRTHVWKPRFDLG